MNHIKNNSGNNEWYTPNYIIEAAKKVLGTIDLDPASSDVANSIIKANIYYTIENDGLTKDWFGNIWLNPPYGKNILTPFINKLIKEIRLNHINNILVLLNNSTETKAIQDLFKVMDCICFLKGRIKFLDKTGKPAKSPLQGQMVLFHGKNIQSFYTFFKELGAIAFL